jgi:predicted nucleic acid-binding protein
MEFHRVHYLDASVLVKLLVKEHGTEVIEYYMKAEYNSSYQVTSLCFAEALTVLKAKHLDKNRPDHIDEETYLTAADELRAYISSGRIELADVDIADSAVFTGVEIITRTYKLDIIDAYQIVTVQRDYFSRFPEAKPMLITADRRLAHAARAEGLRVWNCMREPPP